MKKYLIILICCIFVINVNAEKINKKTHRILIGGCSLGMIAIVGHDGEIEWQLPFKDEVSDLWLLPNGNILHSYKKGGIREIKPNLEKKQGAEIIWEWKTEPYNGKIGEIHTCQPLPEGRILVGESHNGISFIKEINREGKTLKVIELKGLGGKHSTFRQIRKTAKGTYLITQQKKNGKAMEYDADGKLIKTFPSGRFTASRLDNGNTLIGCGDEHRIIEVDKDNKIVWEVKQKDIEGMSLGFIAAVKRLPNGNTVLTNWGGHGGSKGPAVFEITPDKKIAWKISDKIKNRVSSFYIIE